MLQHAAQHGFPTVCTALAAAGANLEAALPSGHTALIHTVLFRNAEYKSEADKLAIVEALLAAGADVNKTNKGSTAMTFAKKNNFSTIVAALRAVGGKDPQALVIAAEKGDLAAVEALIADGEDVNFADEGSWTALLVSGGLGMHDIFLRTCLLTLSLVALACGAVRSPQGMHRTGSGGRQSRSCNHCQLW